MKKRFTIAIGIILLLIICICCGEKLYRQRVFLNNSDVITSETEQITDAGIKAKTLFEITGFQFDTRIPLYHSLAEHYNRIQIKDSLGTVLKCAEDNTDIIHMFVSRQERENISAVFVCVENIDEQTDDYILLCQLKDKTGNGFTDGTSYKLLVDGMLWDLEPDTDSFALYYFAKAKVILKRQVEIGGVLLAESPIGKYKFAQGADTECAETMQFCGQLFFSNDATDAKLLSVQLKKDRKQPFTVWEEFDTMWWIDRS